MARVNFDCYKMQKMVYFKAWSDPDQCEGGFNIVLGQLDARLGDLGVLADRGRSTEKTVLATGVRIDKLKVLTKFILQN